VNILLSKSHIWNKENGLSPYRKSKNEEIGEIGEQINEPKIASFFQACGPTRHCS